MTQITQLPTEILSQITSLLGPRQWSALGIAASREALTTLRDVADDAFNGTAYILQAPTGLTVDKASSKYPTSHIYVRSTIDQESKRCLCKSPRSNVDNTKLSSAIRDLVATDEITGMTVNCAGMMMWDLKAYMQCDLLEFTKTVPSLFVLTDEERGPERFVFRCATPALPESYKEIDSDQGTSTLGSALSLLSKTFRGASATPPPKKPKPQGTQYFFGTLKDDVKLDYDVREWIAEQIVDRHTGYTENHVVVVDPLRFFTDSPGFTMEVAKQEIWRSIRSIIGNTNYWMEGRNRTSLPDWERREIQDQVEAHLHVMSKEDFGELTEGSAANQHLIGMAQVYLS